MAAQENELYLRRCSLLLVGAGDALDLSEMRVTFETKQEDEQGPNNCSIRVYNLSAATVKKIQGEYSRVVLQAGYQNASFGVIFDGTIRQFREGREDARTTYLDILAADGDKAYNFSVVSKSVAAGVSPRERIATIVQAMNANGVSQGQVLIEGTSGILPRGKVLFGLARVALGQEVEALGSTWNIDNGRVNVVPLTGYLPGEAVVLNSATGLLGRPEQTQEGVTARCLINPRIRLGGLVKIDQASVNKTLQQKDAAIPGAQLAYNQYAGLQMFADVSADGLYRVYVSEYRGDTRGTAWWQDLTLLSVDPTTLKVKRYG